MANEDCLDWKVKIMNKHPGAMCEECGDVFFCEHQQQQVKMSLAVKEWLDKADQADEALQEQFRKYGYIIPDDKDITGSD